MKKFMLVLLISVGCMTLGACANTLDGAGRDLENAGRTMQDSF